MLTIVVPSRKIRTMTADGSVMAVRPMLVKRDGRLKHLQEQITFSSLDRIRLVLRTRWKYKRFPRIDRVEEALKQFLSTHQIQGDLFFDCYAFVNMVHGIKSHRFGEMSCYWKPTPETQEPFLGDVAFLFGRAKDGWHFRHAAIYIGFKSYLSVYGAWGDLEISTLKDMKRDFCATKAIHVRPRHESVAYVM